MVSQREIRMNTPSRISRERIEKSVSVISSEFLNSPQYICESLSAELGARVLVKIETANPIRSFKGRGAELYMSKIPAGTEVVCASAGNFGQAMAYAARRRGIRVSVVAARNANPLKIERMKSLGADVILAGEDFDSARAHARLLSAERSARLVVDSLDIETVEGAGTIGLELSRLHQQLDVLLVALGNGAMFNGIAHVIKKFSPRTRMVAVGAEGASAMVDSWRAGQLIEHDHVSTIADGIATRTPIPEALQDMHGLVDEALLVSDENIIRGMKLLHRHVGVVAEPSAAVGVAAMLQKPKAFNGSLVGIIVCGGNLTSEQMQAWL
jgi:threonine dehydratase